MILWHFFLHFTGSDNVSGAYYGFWSGFGGDLSLLGAAAAFLRQKNCHSKGCWRLGKHPFEHFVYCSKHHPNVEG